MTCRSFAQPRHPYRTIEATAFCLCAPESAWVPALGRESLVDGAQMSKSQRRFQAAWHLRRCSELRPDGLGEYHQNYLESQPTLARISRDRQCGEKFP